MRWAGQDTPLPYALAESIPGYECRLAKETTAEPILVSWHDPIFVVGGKDGFDSSFDGERDEPCEECNRFVEYAQAKENYRLTVAEESCQYGFELLGNKGSGFGQTPEAV